MSGSRPRLPISEILLSMYALSLPAAPQRTRAWSALMLPPPLYLRSLGLPARRRLPRTLRHRRALPRPARLRRAQPRRQEPRLAQLEPAQLEPAQLEPA